MEGCLLVIGVALLALLVLSLVVGLIVEAGAVGWVVLGVLIVGGIVYKNHREQARERERAEAQQRREQERAEARRRRGQRTALFGARRNRPIDEGTPLPRRWASPLGRSVAALGNYKQAIEGMRDGPQRQQLQAHQSYLTERVEECQQLARRAAELERQLQRLETDDEGLWTGFADSVEAAERRLDEMVAETERLAAKAAEVALTQSMSDVAELDEAVENLARDLQATDEAFSDLESNLVIDPSTESLEAVASAGSTSEDAANDAPTSSGALQDYLQQAHETTRRALGSLRNVRRRRQP